MTELWRPMKNYEDLYLISNYGRIKSLIKRGNYSETVKKTFIDVSTGYINVQLSKNGKPLTKRIHRLVAEVFVENPYNYPIVNHKDGNKKNNKADNLEWTTYSENTKHSFLNKLQKKIFGDDNYITKIKDCNVCEIKKLIEQGKTNKEIASLYSVNPSQISRIKSGKRRLHIQCDDIC